jgi:tRNA (guanosine-2'-O-)-methyltransferase
MQGMVESLNISVACAVSLYEAMRQRRAAGGYDRPSLAERDLQALEADWLRK